MTDTERRLAAALAEHAPFTGPISGSWTCPDPCGARSTDSDPDGYPAGRRQRAAEHAAHLAAALLPVVAEIEAEARAGALREAADEMDRHDVVTIEDTDIGSNLIPVSPADRLRRMADEMKEQG